MKKIVGLFSILSVVYVGNAYGSVVAIDTFDVFNQNIYDVSYQGNHFDYYAQDGRLYVEKDETPGDTWNKIIFQAKYQLVGDFSIELDYFLEDFGVGNQLEFQVFAGNVLTEKRFLTSRGNGFFYRDDTYAAINHLDYHTNLIYDTEDTEGTMKIERLGDSFYGYFLNDEDWVSLGAGEAELGTDVYINLVAQNNTFGNGPSQRSGFSELRILTEDYSGVDPNTEPPVPEPTTILLLGIGLAFPCLKRVL